MELDNEKVRSKKLYSVGFSKELDSYVMSIVVPWVAWYKLYTEMMSMVEASYDASP